MDTDQRLIDMRSDTVTRPTPDMRKAMSTCVVGDDVWGDDPTILRLEAMAANFLGKPAAVFVPSGTMANLCAIMTHCTYRHSEMIVGDKSHICIYEAGGSASLAGVMTRAVPNKADGTMDIKLIEEAIQPIDSHKAKTQLICIENTHCAAGGAPLSIEYMRSVFTLARRRGLAIHLDGARICNAAVALNTSPKMLASYVDSVSMCFSKGLASPVGSVLAGPVEFISRARHSRKALGGGMRQAGVLAACAIISIEKMFPRLIEDHQNAAALRKGLQRIQWLKVLPSWTNMTFIEVDFDKLESSDDSEDFMDVMKECGLLINHVSNTTNRFRLVT
eukprot:35667_1